MEYQTYKVIDTDFHSVLATFRNPNMATKLCKEFGCYPETTEAGFVPVAFVSDGKDESGEWRCFYMPTFKRPKISQFRFHQTAAQFIRN